MMKYAYYPGCSAKSSTPEADHSTRVVSKKLGIDLFELETAGCCGSREVRIKNANLAISLNARILALSEAEGVDICVICSTCQLNLAETNRIFMTEPEKLQKVNQEVLSKLGLKYTGKTRVKNFLNVVVEDVGLKYLEMAIQKPLYGLRVGPFYGCHFLRPREIAGLDEGEKLTILEDLIHTLGGDPVGFDGDSKCCGFHVVLIQEKFTCYMAGKYMKNAREKGAQCLVTPCNLCHVILDCYQRDAEKLIKYKLQLPVFHTAQLVGLALGVHPLELMLNKHMVSTKTLLL